MLASEAFLFYQEFLEPAVPLLVIVVLVLVILALRTLRLQIKAEIDRLAELLEGQRHDVEQIHDLYQRMLERQGRETHQRSRVSALMRELERRIDAKTAPDDSDDGERGGSPPD